MAYDNEDDQPNGPTSDPDSYDTGDSSTEGYEADDGGEFAEAFDPPEEGHDAEPPPADDPHGGEMDQTPVPLTEDPDEIEDVDENATEYEVEDSDSDEDADGEPQESDDDLLDDDDDELLDTDPEKADG